MNLFFHPFHQVTWCGGQVAARMLEFPGGIKKLFQFLREHLRYPDAAVSAKVCGTVFVGFDVQPDGSVTYARVLKGIGYGCDEEALRAVKAMPPWKPAEQSGRPVAIAFSLPVRFTCAAPGKPRKRWFILPGRRTFSP